MEEPDVRPLKNIYDGPIDLLAKARRDREALQLAVNESNELVLRDKLFDFSLTAYHIVDWVKAFHPDLAPAAYALLNAVPALGACRDLANANKHFALALERGPYRSHPPTVGQVDYSAAPPVSADLPTARRWLKVVLVEGTRLRVEDVVDQALSAWEKFFTDHGLAP